MVEAKAETKKQRCLKQSKQPWDVPQEEKQEGRVQGVAMEGRGGGQQQQRGILTQTSTLGLTLDLLRWVCREELPPTLSSGPHLALGAIRSKNLTPHRCQSGSRVSE